MKPNAARDHTVKEIEESLEKVRELIKDMRYGNITLIVQDGRVIQIDKTEKIRI